MRQSPRKWIPLGAAIALHLALVVSIARQPLFVNRAAPSSRSLVWPIYHDSVYRPGPWADFYAVYHAGVAMEQGRDPYQGIEDPVVTPYAFPFRYLPVVAGVLGRVFILLPPSAAGQVWLGLVEVVLATFVILFRRRAAATWPSQFATIVLLLSSPYFLELHMGQFTFVTLALTGIALLLLEERAEPVQGAPARSPLRFDRRVHAAAACFTLAILLKVFPLVLAPALARRGKAGWFCLLVAVGAAAILNAPYFVRHPAAWTAFYRENFSAASALSGLDAGNFGLLYAFFRGAAETGYRWTIAGWAMFSAVWRIALLGSTALLVLLVRRRDLILAGCLLILAHFLSYPHVWEHHYSGVILVLLLGLGRVVQLSRSGGGRALARLLAGAVVLLALPTPFLALNGGQVSMTPDPLAGWSAGARLALPLSKAAPLVVCFVLLALALRRASSNSVTARSTGRPGR